MFLSAASTNARTAEEETPCASGLLRGKPGGSRPRGKGTTPDDECGEDQSFHAGFLEIVKRVRTGESLFQMV